MARRGALVSGAWFIVCWGRVAWALGSMRAGVARTAYDEHASGLPAPV